MTNEAVAHALSADRPSTDPSEDLFGHAPFARTLAKAIQGYSGSDGIVLALYGPWGSGKSTVLAYVEHELERAPAAERPVVVSFNPWWFSGQEHLAKAFLGQLQAVLPAKYKGFEKVGNMLAEFSGALGGIAEVAGKSHGIPFLGKVVEAGARRLATKPKDVPALKKALSSQLLEQRKRVLVVIDDIDRLAPDEVRQLFTVIKALADFPYVTYLLAFDREVAATAIGEQTGLPGDRYLEKIIQVPFELPRVDKTTLRQALFAKLDAVMADTPTGRFDSTHWANVFHSGLDPLFTVPRDIIRLTNALSVTYPAVVGEVNPVDFIAVECLRVWRCPRTC
jgi:predicted KAP-like P-loop ATPase